MAALLFFTSCNKKEEMPEVEQWNIYEINLEGPSSGNPYLEVETGAQFSDGSENYEVPGFYDGEGIYRIRFSPPRQGIWTYKTHSNQDALSGREGKFRCISPTGNNHGPLTIVNTHYLRYADSTDFYAVGTTAYQWTSVKQEIQQKTLETLANAPFNKIRMCFFPKSYRYGNDTEPFAYPFQRDGDQNDFTQPNYAFFQNFDRRVADLRELGIQADVILFHPYDRWGYSKMGKEMNEKYVRYLIARLSAYRNVWWSLANEWDLPDIRETIDWEGIGTLLQKEDPHQRFRGIHNWYNTEDHFYDHSRPWITHISTQTSDFFNAIKWRNRYQKPLLFDEMRYEGDVESGWGNMSAEEMTSYFWMAGLSGGYGTHGDTFKNDADTTEVRWWGKGGTLPGKSPEKIRFFRSVMEDAPVIKMQPQLFVEGDSAELNNNVYLFSEPGSYYLAYVADSEENINIDLPGNTAYQLEVIDTWNMTILEQKQVAPGTFNYKTSQPFTALRLKSGNYPEQQSRKADQPN